MENLLTIQNLSITFADKDKKNIILDRVNLALLKGKCLGLVGESGSGKSLTALSIMRLLPYAARMDNQTNILFRGQNLLDLNPKQMRKIRGRHIAMIFQEALTALNPILTVGHQIDEVLRAHFKLSKHERVKRIYQLLTEVGIDDLKRIAQSYPHQLSGGQRQRAMIAIALAGEPELLIADEPTTSLDVTLQASILELLKKIQGERQMSLLFITHDLAVMAQIADDIAVMKQGKIVETAEVKQFFSNPKHPYSQQLFTVLPEEKRLSQIELEPIKQRLIVNDLKIYFPIRKGLFKRTVGYIKAVDGVSFNLMAGRTLALVGESGSGKTTIGLGVLQLEKITSGKVQFENNDLLRMKSRKLRKLRRYMQIIFQDPYSSLDPRMRIIDIISEGLKAQGILKNNKQCQYRVEELLKQVGLEVDHLYRYPHEFSGGQRQRICIARALALEPKLLILDEPTSALDTTVQRQVLMLLKKLQNELGLSYLFITHNFSVVKYMADEVAVMHQGKIIEYGGTGQILTMPQHAYTKRLLAAVPIPTTL